MMRSHTCGELRLKDKKKRVELCGWCATRRDHGGVIFIDLRDRWGITQVVFNPKFCRETHKKAERLRREDVIRVEGEIRERKKGMKNLKLATGEIEVFIDELEILNKAEVPPIEIDERKVAGEETRLRYRYLDLRRGVMQERLRRRHEAAQAVREFLNKEGFMEIETPLLIRHTPEGARDFLVPSRVHAGKFFVLPQSPQLYKQILMVAGFDRYYQLARCLRDEDLREDRQLEFTQIDLEMSFVDEEDVLKVSEGLMKYIWKKVLGVELGKFERLSYEEAMERFGTDKPDLRFGLELKTVSEVFKDSEFKVFMNLVRKGGIVKCLKVEKELSRKKLEELTSGVEEWGGEGLVWLKVKREKEGEKLEGPIAKFLNKKGQKELIKKIKGKKGDTLLLVGGGFGVVNDVLGRLRLRLGEELGLVKEGKEGKKGEKEGWKFVWITDFPLYEWDEEEGRWSPMHHIFSMPKEEEMRYLEKEPGKVKGKLYDLVLNGVELAGGSVRIHKKEVQEKVLKVIGMSYEEAEKKFGFLLEAFKYGAPPHGGIAFGFDRVCALICGISDIREVMAFPKTKRAESPLDGCPTEIEEGQLKEVHVLLDEVAKRNIKKK